LARIYYYTYVEKIKINHSLLDEYDISKKISYNDFFDQSRNLILKYKEDDDIFKKFLKIQLDENNRHLMKI
jgi:hypothetical protein